MHTVIPCQQCGAPGVGIGKVCAEIKLQYTIVCGHCRKAAPKYVWLNFCCVDCMTAYIQSEKFVCAVVELEQEAQAKMEDEDATEPASHGE